MPIRLKESFLSYYSPFIILIRKELLLVDAVKHHLTGVKQNAVMLGKISRLLYCTVANKLCKLVIIINNKFVMTYLRHFSIYKANVVIAVVIFKKAYYSVLKASYSLYAVVDIVTEYGPIASLEAYDVRFLSLESGQDLTKLIVEPLVATSEHVVGGSWLVVFIKGRCVIVGGYFSVVESEPYNTLTAESRGHCYLPRKLIFCGDPVYVVSGGKQSCPDVCISILSCIALTLERFVVQGNATVIDRL